MKVNLALKFCVSVLILLSCKREATDIKTEIDNPKIKGLKEWFESNKSIETNWLSETTPDWSRVYTIDRDSVVVYEVTLLNGNKAFTGVDGQNKSDKDRAQNNKISLILIQQKKSSSIAGYYMNLINQEGTVDWENVHYANPKGMPKGMLNYHTLDGHFLNGWLVKDGVIVNRIGRSTSLFPMAMAATDKFGNDGKLVSGKKKAIIQYGGECGNVLINDYNLACVEAGGYQTCTPYIANSYTLYIPCGENNPNGPGTAGGPGGQGEPDPWENPANYGPPTTFEMEKNTPIGNLGVIEIDGCEAQLDQPDQRDPVKGNFKIISRVEGQIKTKRGTVITDWVDNTGRKHVHIKMDTYYSGFFNSFTTDLLSIGTGVTIIFDMFRSGKVFVPPTSWASFYGAETKYIVEEMQEYYEAKKQQNQKNGTTCKPK